MRGKNLFLQYFFSYVGIILLSVCIFGVLFYYFNATILNAEVTNSRFASASQSLGKIDSMMESMAGIAHRFSSLEAEAGYHQYRQQRMQAAFPDLMAHRLENFTNQMPVQAQALFYFRGDANIYLNSGRYRYADFANMAGNHIDMTISRIFSEFNSSLRSRAVQIPWEEESDSSKGVLFVYPIPYMSFIPRATLGFLFTEQELSRIFSNYLGDSRKNIYLLDNNLNFLFSQKTIPINENEMDKLMTMRGTGVFDNHMLDRSLIVMRALSERSGYSLIIVMERQDFFTRVGLMQRVIIACLMFFIAISILWALIMTTRIYRPIKALANYDMDEEEAKPSAHFNELDVIQRRIDSARRLIDLQRPYVLFTCLNNILRGKVDNRQELLYMMQCANVIFAEPYLQVLLVAPTGRERISGKIQAILEACEEIKLPGCHLHSVELVLEKQVALIANFCEKSTEDQLTGITVAKRLQQILSQSEVEVTIGVGLIYEQLEDVHTSFVEATTVVNEYIASYSDNIMCFDQIPADKNLDYALSAVDQFMLKHALTQGDHSAALLTLARLVSGVAESSGTALLIQYMCFDIANTLFNTMRQEGSEVQLAELQSLSDYQNLEEFHHNAQVIVKSICDKYDNLKERKNNQLSANVIQYVNEKYMEHSFSLEETATYFGLSSSHLSRFFKQATGQTFVQYVTQLRMNYIKRQLAETDMQIKDIVTHAGYIDAASFVRKFKNAEGITPSQYRWMVRHGIANKEAIL